MIDTRILLILLLVSSIPYLGKGQDVHFSQYQLNPLMLSSAKTGQMEGDLQAGFMYRNQWRKASRHPFKTFSAYAEKKFYRKMDHIGGGLVIVGDRSGPANYTSNRIYFSGAYHKKFGYHKLVVGIQPGIVSNGIGNTTFPAQFDYSIGQFNSDLPALEPNLKDAQTFLDFNTGLLYHYQKEGLSVSVGQAFAHVFSPNASLVKDHTYELPVRYISHANAHINLTSKIALKPNFLYMHQNEATEVNAASLVQYRFNNAHDLAMRLGLGYRNNTNGFESNQLFKNDDALSILSGFRYKFLDLGLAYDLTVSDFNEANNGNGAWEIALTYIYPLSSQPRQRRIPCQRY